MLIFRAIRQGESSAYVIISGKGRWMMGRWVVLCYLYALLICKIIA